MRCCTKASASVCKSSSLMSSGSESGALDRASAAYRNFPGTWIAVYLYFASINRNFKIRGGKSSRCFELRSGIKGLWSDSATKDHPRM